MPTPHGPRGGMAFSADELRVLRRALAEALQQPSRRTNATPCATPRQARAEDVHDYLDYLRLVEAMDEAIHEGGRLRTFLSAELIRYRQALPGAASGYLERLRGALDSGYVPGPDDLAALRRLRGQPCGPGEDWRRSGLLRRCEHLAEQDVQARLEALVPTATVPASRRRVSIAERSHLLSLPGGRTGSSALDVLFDAEPSKPEKPGKAAPRPDKPRPPAKKPEPEPEPAPEPPSPAPGRRAPTPAEIWPPKKRRPKPPEDARSAS